jgi:dienelactone hydrolase
VIDIVRAARQLDSQVGTRWVALGHSLGGGAVVFTAGSAKSWAPELQLLGAVDIAGSGRAYLATLLASHTDVAAGDWPLAIAGAAAANHSVKPERFLTPAALTVLRKVDSACQMDVLAAANAIHANAITQPGADLTALDQVLKSQDPAAVKPVVPLLVVQGTADEGSPKSLSDAIVTALCKNGATVQYSVYQGQSHEGVVATALTEIQNWIHGRFAGQPAPSNCPR